MDTLLDITGRVAIVTGGGTGIGAATARLLATHGAEVVIAGRTVETLEDTAAGIREATGRRCLVIPTDVRDEAQVETLMQRTADEFGRLDILINNAGGTHMGPLKSLPTKTWDATFDLNVRAAYFCTREAGKHFLAQRSGAIVNISSGAGINGTKGGAPYSAAKAALQMLTTVTAAEWGSYGVRVNCVAPGFTASERAAARWTLAGIDSTAVAANIPLRRIGQPVEIANAVLFLVSEAASYITGAILPVNGGPQIGGIPNSAL